MDVPAEKPVEKFSWGKYISGILNPLNFAKYSSFILQMVLIFFVGLLVLKTGIKIKTWLFPVPAQRACIASISGGKVDASTDKKMKFGLNIL